MRMFCDNTFNSRLVLDSIPHGMVVMNSEGQIEFINAMAISILMSDNTDDLDQNTLMQSLLNEVGLTDICIRCCSDIKTDSGILEFKPPEKDSIIRGQWSVIKDEQGVRVGATVLFEDITNSITDERAKEQFITTISHELRTPIAIIRNSISNMVAGVAGKMNCKASEYLEKMNSECHRISFLVNNLVDMAKIESGQMPINLIEIDLHSVISMVCENFTSSALAKNIDLRCEWMQDIPRVLLDEKRIQQVLWNLVNNAIKFTPEGGSVVIKAFIQNDHLYLTVEDTGIGLSKEQQKFVFNRFYQICRKKGAGYNGSGLGLAISKGIIRAHGGNIWAEGELGKGSRFIISLPAERVFTLDDDFDLI